MSDTHSSTFHPYSKCQLLVLHTMGYAKVVSQNSIVRLKIVVSDIERDADNLHSIAKGIEF